MDLVKNNHIALKMKSSLISKFDSKLKETAKSMFSILKDKNGIGIAANQVGILQRISIISFNQKFEDSLILINPEIISLSEEKIIILEGCLSFPKIERKILRPKNIKIQYYNLKEEKSDLEASGILARCLQHEIDHLNGTLFIDYASM